MADLFRQFLYSDRLNRPFTIPSFTIEKTPLLADDPQQAGDRTQNDHPSSLQKVIALCVPILSNSNLALPLSVCNVMLRVKAS
jgi:hypothetical protein